MTAYGQIQRAVRNISKIPADRLQAHSPRSQWPSNEPTTEQLLSESAPYRSSVIHRPCAIEAIAFTAELAEIDVLLKHALESIDPSEFKTVNLESRLLSPAQVAGLLQDKIQLYVSSTEPQTPQQVAQDLYQCLHYTLVSTVALDSIDLNQQILKPLTAAAISIEQVLRSPKFGIRILAKRSGLPFTISIHDFETQNAIRLLSDATVLWAMSSGATDLEPSVRPDIHWPSSPISISL
ncbi:hypothetical protein [Glutamicibacter nicotianae]|uniref:hypothetical protein n=1 Tax=Glutamicibacter nicotianae TaxID=37929 RepID=UPI0030797A96